MKARLVVFVVLAGLFVGIQPTRASPPATSWAARMVATREQRMREDAAGGDHNQRDHETPAPAMSKLLQHFWETFPETDWFLQDQPCGASGRGEIDAQRDFGWFFRADRNADGEAAMIRRVLSELTGKKRDLVQRLERLEAKGERPGNVAWLNLYVDACRRRRAQRLRVFSAQVPRIVFTKHYTLGGSHYAYTEGQSDAQAERHFQPGSELCLLMWDGHDFQQQTLLRDEQGVIRDPDVSYDGQRILFSWKKSDREDDYHLYEMNVQTRQVRQLTFGLGVADYEGAYLPDGDIIFNSTRCVQTVDCWWTEVSNLYRCDADGRYLRRLAFDQVHDNFPTITPDGRVLYTRWEYNDRGQIYPQPLLQMNVDGTNQREFYGGNSWFPTTILHARGIPGGTKVLAIATGHHSRQTGKLIEIDPSEGRQENEGVTLVAPPRETPGQRIDAYGQQGELFQYPYPLDAQHYLVAYHPAGWKWAHGAMGPRFGVYAMTRDGQRELLAADATLPCNQPIPLRPRTERRVRPSQVDYRRATGTCYIQDVYEGPGLDGVPRGTIKRLRVIALDFRAAGIGSNNNRGPGGGALISTPIAIGNGAWDPKIILGDATVHEDGSVYFEMPARRPVYFQLLDQRGYMVQTMRSWTTLQPGERASCIGCHEHKNQVPVAHRALSAAMTAGPETLQPFLEDPQGFSFPKQIQPILNRHCVSCHNSDGQIAYDLTGVAVADLHAKRYWSRSYLQLTHAAPDIRSNKSKWRGSPEHALVNWVSAQSAPPMLSPYSAGASTSQLMHLIEAGHEGVALSRQERETIAAWIDLGVPYCGDYVEANRWDQEERAKYQRFLNKRKRLADEERRQINRLIKAND
jgi:hypothetical protein